MKLKIFISMLISSMTMMILTISCTDLQEADMNTTEHLKSIELRDSILEERTLLGDDIYLPKGTHWYYTNENRSEVVFELPEGYTFLLKNTKTEEYSLSNEGGGYSCACSSGDSCTTFYNKGLGYGCLQNDCTGSCTGKRASIPDSNLQIVGVLNAKNDILDANID